MGLNKLKLEVLRSRVGLNIEKFVGLCKRLKRSVRVASVKDGLKMLRFEGGLGMGVGSEVEGGVERGCGKGRDVVWLAKWGG